MTKEEIIELANRVASGLASDDEIFLLNRIYNSFQIPANEKVETHPEGRNDLAAQIKETIDKRITNRKPVVKLPFLRYTAAAAVIFLIFTSYFLFLTKKSVQELATQSHSSPVHNEIAPGKDGATLTLANGKTIVLEEAGNGKLTEQAVKKDNLVSYQNASATAVEYNTVSTPNGRQFSLVLADGSKVWLNAASSIHFPTAFIGKERRVEITGEAYFEITPNASKPFYVIVNGMDIEVVGTHFNVMAYSDEDAIKTTLLEGKVKVKKGGAIAMLLPGQQAEANNNGEIKLTKNADVDAAVAWKNGLFQFNGADVKTIGRQIERWYDIEVLFSGNPQSAHLSGEVPRTLNLSQVIKVLETSGIDVKTEGRKLLITPKP